MQIYNSRRLDSNTRFILAIIAGFFAAIIAGILYGLLSSVLRVEVSIVFVFIGWCIGYVVRVVGRGVHLRFAIVGAIMTLIAIFIGDIIAMIGFNNLFSFAIIGSSINLSGLPALINIWAASLLSTSINNILRLLFRAIGVYFGYQYARVL